ncbi:MAG: ATP-grasp domain-containing protein [Muribaculaceae bacterium]|nr:ATP-grasp domain-containing protein [Muribaculaceae bacterium]MDE6297263.1 ATP-grasp domain-containing protein [Muribaculaceae bacterium]
MKTTILMLGGSRRVSLADLFKESGRRLGIDVEIVSYELTRHVPIALAGKVLEGLKWTDPDVVNDIARVVREYNVDIILPFVNGAVEVASKCKEKIPGVFVPVSDFSLTSRIFDKVEAAKVFKDNGFPIPRTYSIINNEMPAIVKPRKGGSSRGIRIFYDVEDLMHLENLDSYIIQEYIENAHEYTVDCYVDHNGEILVTVPRERIEIMGGEVNRTKTCRIERIIEMSREVINKLKLTGCVTLQFLHDPQNDRYLLMELNPRLGGGVICSIYAGAPITDYILSEAMGKALVPCNDWKDNVLMARYMKEAIFYE